MYGNVRRLSTDILCWCTATFRGCTTTKCINPARASNRMASLHARMHAGESYIRIYYTYTMYVEKRDGLRRWRKRKRGIVKSERGREKEREIERERERRQPEQEEEVEGLRLRFPFRSPTHMAHIHIFTFLPLFLTTLLFPDPLPFRLSSLLRKA